MGGKRGKGPVAKRANKIRTDKLIARARAIAAGKGVAPATCTGEDGVQGEGDETEEELTASLQEAFPMIDAELVQLLVAECTEDGAPPPHPAARPAYQHPLADAWVCTHPGKRVLLCALRTNPCTCLFALHRCNPKGGEKPNRFWPPYRGAIPYKVTGGALKEAGWVRHLCRARDS